MSNNKYMLFCQNCGQKHFTDGDVTGLTEVKVAPLPKKANGAKDIYELPKRFRCYNCGMIFKVIKLSQPKQETKVEDPFFEEDYIKKWENEVLRSARKSKD